MNINIPSLSTQIDPKHLSKGEQVFIHRLIIKSDNGRELKPEEENFIQAMASRNSFKHF